MWLAAAVAAAGRRAAWRAPHAARGFTHDAAEALMAEYQAGRTPQVVPFELAEVQARDKFLAWQRGTARLAPSALLPEGGPWRMRAALLPFWLFDMRARVEYAGSVGTHNKDDSGTTWREVGWRELPEREYSWQTDKRLQVYASYKYRRDYAAAVHGPWALKQLQPLPRGDAERGSYGCRTVAGGWQGGDIDPPAMRQAIAWEFVLRDVRDAEAHAAEQRLLAAHGAHETRDVHVRLHVLDHSARLAFLPAFHLEYEHGEDVNVHGERVPAQFEALISGTPEGGVAGTRHFSAHKAGGGLLVGAMGASAAAAPLLGMDPWALVNIESAFVLLSTASMAGLGARMLPVWLHQVAEERRMRASDAEFERVVSMGMGPLDLGTEEQEVLRSSAEWRRWESIGSQPWREHKRHVWAEELFEAQQRRRVEREQLRERLEAERARQEEEERREERRQRRWGRSHHAHHWAQRDPLFAGGRGGGGRRDYLHYYRMLGLEVAHERGHVTQEDIKHAFRRAALRWHPDKQDGHDEQGRRAAREKFQQIRTAYDVLRDPEKRRAYDRGEAVEM